MSLEFHHCSKRINKDNFDLAIKLFQKLGFVLEDKWVEPDNVISAILNFPSKSISLQLLSSEDPSIPTYNKKDSHVCLITNNPKKELLGIKSWASKHHLKYIENSFSDKEFYFDLPELFIDFVIEIMHRSVVEP